jgi:hypothetical protein
MANLNVSAGILGAYPWLERIIAATGSCKTRILMVADGDIDFGHHSFGLSRLVEALRQSHRPGEEFVVSTALRGEREDGKEADDYLFKFESEAFGIERYEQVWLFGFLETKDTLTEPELKVLAEFMNKGGGSSLQVTTRLWGGALRQRTARAQYAQVVLSGKSKLYIACPSA